MTIRDAFPTPKECDNCCSPNIELTTSDKVHGRTYGNKKPNIYNCNDCGATVGCHPNTTIPLGRMADRQTRLLRIKAHVEFDKLWQTGLMHRSKAYSWLSSELGIEFSQCHISLLSKDQLKDVATLSADYLKTQYKALVRRKAKRDAKQQKRNERANAIERRITDEARRKRTKHKPR